MTDYELLRIRDALPLPSECEGDKLDFPWVIQTNNEGDIQIQKHVLKRNILKAFVLDGN